MKYFLNFLSASTTGISYINREIKKNYSLVISCHLRLEIYTSSDTSQISIFITFKMTYVDTLHEK